LRGRTGILSGFFDRDAATYIAAVEFADGQALEDAIKIAINAYVIGLKTDGIWNSVLASCIMMGARTLTGALIPLKGTAPTSVNFVSGDYNRETGLKGNGSNKYIDTNFLDSSTYRIDIHHGVFQTTDLTDTGGTSRAVISARNTSTGTNASQIFSASATLTLTSASRATAAYSMLDSDFDSFIAISRGNSSNYIYRNGTANNTITQAASADTSGVNFRVYTREGAPNYSLGRYAYYTVGTHIDATGLSNYQTRIIALYNAIAAAIP
jgi:hypothetical protein